MFQVTTNTRNYRIYNVIAIFICHSVSYIIIHLLKVIKLVCQNQNINFIIIHKSMAAAAANILFFLYVYIFHYHLF